MDYEPDTVTPYFWARVPHKAVHKSVDGGGRGHASGGVPGSNDAGGRDD